MRCGWEPTERKLSYEWLAGLREIVIDAVRCPLAYEKFRLMEYDRDLDGTWVDDIPDGNDHSINALRYAVMGGAVILWLWCLCPYCGRVRTQR